MSVQFVLGRAGTGKTTSILHQIRDKVVQDPKGPPLILIVPEQATFQAEFSLATLPGLGGIMRVQVLSFGRLAYRVLQEAGGLARLPVNELGKQMVLRMLVERHKHQLQVFGSSAGQPGFTAQLAQMISECKRYELTAVHLQRNSWGSTALDQKVHDLRFLLDAYQEYLGDSYYDTDDMLTLVAEKIAHSPYLAQAEIWIDGFSGFTKQEYHLITQLMKQAKRVVLALCLDPLERDCGAVDELSVFYPSQTTHERLQECARDAAVPVEPPLLLTETRRFAESPLLSHLQQHYFRWDKQVAYPAADQSEEVKLVSASTRRDEVHSAALEMLSLAKQKDYRFRDMAVVVRDIGTYAEELASVFSEYGIPFFLDQKRPVLHHPVIELVRSALEAYVNHFRYESVFRCLKTDLVRPAVRSVSEARQDIDQLENYALAYGIQGSMWAQESDWVYHGSSAEYPAIDETRRTYIRPLLEFSEDLRKAERLNARAMSAAVYRLLENLEVSSKLEDWSAQSEAGGDLEKAREHAQVWNGLIELLDQVVEAMGDVQLDCAHYARILDSGLESLRLGLVPPLLDQVVIGSLERSRQPNVKAVFLLGANEGVIPMKPRENSLLDESERERLSQAGIELAPSSRQRLLAEQFLLYQALTRASHRLWISFPISDQEGKSLLPSPLFARLRQLIPGVHLKFSGNQPTGAASEDLFLLGAPRQAFRHLLMLLRGLKQGTPLTPFWWTVYEWFVQHSPNAQHEQWLLSGLAKGNAVRPLSPSMSEQLYGRDLHMSVSRLEIFQKCPFAHFSAYGLKLAERQRYQLERFDVGELFHASLKRAADQMRLQQLNWATLTEQDSMQLAIRVVQELVPETRASILSRTARYRYLSGKLTLAVGRAIAVFSEHARRSGFSPVGLEVSFGEGADLPGISLRLRSGGKLQLRGRIDRVDYSRENGRAFLRVIDYKSSPKSLTLSDVWHGLNLQLLVYLDVVIAGARNLVGEQADVGGVFYYQIADPFISAGRALSTEDVQKRRASRLRMKGLMLADRDVARLMDKETSVGTSDLLPFGIKKEGEFTARSSVASAEQFRVLQQFVRSKIKEMSGRMVDGDIRILPYAQGPHIACQTCAYKAVCRYEPAVHEDGPRLLQKYADDQVWSWMGKGDADVE